VVSANKALLAEDGATLFAAAEKADRDLYYEAAVAGAIPILRPLRESLAGDRVTGSSASSTAPPTSSSTR
jgi:homoserine dehydrogenase